jgi:hypothetical protein
MADAGEVRCIILLGIKTDIEELNSISAQEKTYLIAAIDKLLKIYRCPSK